MLKSLLLAILLATPTCTFADQSLNTLTRVNESVVTISWSTLNSEGQEVGARCTGFQVGVAWVLTAEHCKAPKNVEIYVEGKIARVVKQDDAFLLIEVPIGRPVLPLRNNALKLGEPITAIGFANGGPLATYKRNFSNLWQGDHVVIDGAVTPGMSGGPMIDADGKVVAIIQGGETASSIGCGVSEIRKFLEGK